MMRLHLALMAVFLVAAGIRAEDDDKARLFNTYYLDGERATYVLILRDNRTFELYGPDNDKISGSLRASAEHITLTAGEVKRYFHFDIKDKDLKLGMRENDRVVKGNLLGEMPPTADTMLRTVYVSEENWKRKGRATRNLAGGSVAPVAPPRVVNSVPVPPPPVESTPAAVAPPKPAGEFQDLSGVFYLPSPKGVNEQLTITSDGRFEYQQADGVKEKGTLMRVGDDLTLMGSAHKRQLTARTTNAGLEMTRRQTDLVKSNDVLGRMPPQDRDAIVWLKSPTQLPPLPATTPAVAPEPVKPSVPAPVVEAPPPPKPVATTPNVPAQVEAVKPAGVAVTAVAQAAGNFVHKPNPFISETLSIGDDSNFTYKDSNGAAASGKVSFDGGVMVFKSGEVVRRFNATIDGGILTLTCAKDDAPSFKNDLATMSPTVLKVAKYDKK